MKWAKRNLEIRNFSRMNSEFTAVLKDMILPFPLLRPPQHILSPLPSWFRNSNGGSRIVSYSNIQRKKRKFYFTCPFSEVSQKTYFSSYSLVAKKKKLRILYRICIFTQPWPGEDCVWLSHSWLLVSLLCLVLSFHKNPVPQPLSTDHEHAHCQSLWADREMRLRNYGCINPNPHPTTPATGRTQVPLGDCCFTSLALLGDQNTFILNPLGLTALTHFKLYGGREGYANKQLSAWVVSDRL